MKKLPLMSPDWDMNGPPPSHEPQGESQEKKTKRGLNFEEEDSDEGDNVFLFKDPDEKWKPRSELEHGREGLFAGPGLAPKEEVIEEFKEMRRKGIEQYGHTHYENQHLIVRNKRIINMLRTAVTSTLALNYTTQANAGVCVIALRVDSAEESNGMLRGQWFVSRNVAGLICFMSGSRIMVMDASQQRMGTLVSRMFFAKPPIMFSLDVEGQIAPLWKVGRGDPNYSLERGNEDIITIVVALTETRGELEEMLFSRAIVYDRRSQRGE